MKQDETRPHFSALRGSLRSLASCPGYTDSHGTWNTGFQCPKWGTEEDEYCCGDTQKRFCCPPPHKPKHHSNHGGGGRKSSSNKDDDESGEGEKIGKTDRKNERFYDGRYGMGRDYDDRTSHKSNKQDNKSNFIINNSEQFDRPPITDELFRTGRITSSPFDLGQVTHSAITPHSPIVQLPMIPLVVSLSVATCVLLLASVVACCCCCSCCVVKRRKKSGEKDNYIKTTSVNLEAEVTSAAIAAQALVMMPGSDSFCNNGSLYNNHLFNNNNNNTPNHVYNTANNLYNNNNVSNMSNNTLSTTSSMSAVYNNIACRGPPSMQLPRGSPEIAPSEVPHSKLHHLHLDSYPPQGIFHDQNTPIINAKEQPLHWQELESMLVCHEKAALHDHSSMDELSSSITNWLPLSKSQLGVKESSAGRWMSENNQQLTQVNNINNNNTNINNGSIKSSHNHSSLHNNVLNSLNDNSPHSAKNLSITNNFTNLKNNNNTEFNNINNCSASFHANHPQAAVSPFPDVTQTSAFNPGTNNNNNSPNSNKLFAKNSCNSNSLKHNNDIGNSSPYKQHTDEHRLTHTRAQTQANIQTEKDVTIFSSKPSLPDIPDCPQLKLTSTWMAMR